MDMKNRDGQGRVVIGIGLIGLGVLFLVNELFNIDLFDVLWPAVIILYGLLFFARMVTGSRQTGRLAIPGAAGAVPRPSRHDQAWAGGRLVPGGWQH